MVKSAVMRKLGLKEQGDERILGSGEFVQSLAETARQMGVTTRAVNYMIRKK
jgi:hypothetical protein